MVLKCNKRTLYNYNPMGLYDETLTLTAVLHNISYNGKTVILKLIVLFQNNFQAGYHMCTHVFMYT